VFETLQTRTLKAHGSSTWRAHVFDGPSQTFLKPMPVSTSTRKRSREDIQDSVTIPVLGSGLMATLVGAKRAKGTLVSVH
jgi:hypothetical protein